jgi:type III pantothenate kinase
MGYTGLVKYLVEAIKTALSDEAKVIGTGGLVQTLPDIKDIFYDINPMLTMEGLRIIGQEYL